MYRAKNVYVLAMDPTLRQTLLDILQHHPNVEFAVVFGSRGNGIPHKESDLDFGYASARGPLPIEEKIALMEDIAIATGFAVDAVDLLGPGGPVLHEILSTGESILGEGSDAHMQAVLRMTWWEQDYAPIWRRETRKLVEQAFP